MIYIEFNINAQMVLAQFEFEKLQQGYLASYVILKGTDLFHRQTGGLKFRKCLKKFCEFRPWDPPFKLFWYPLKPLLELQLTYLIAFVPEKVELL